MIQANEFDCNSLIETGKKLIFPEKHNEWILFVNNNKDKINEIAVALNIMDDLNILNVEEKVQQLKLNNEITKKDVENILLKFSKYGAHFHREYYKLLNEETAKYEWKMLEGINSLNIYLGKKHGEFIPPLCNGIQASELDTLDDVLYKLFFMQELNGILIIKFNNELLYSDTVTTNSAYLKIYGMTKKEYTNSKVKKLVNKK